MQYTSWESERCHFPSDAPTKKVLPAMPDTWLAALNSGSQQMVPDAVLFLS